MADNITALANTGTGTDVLATDLILDVHYPRTKLVLGADGVNDGDVSATNPLPVSGPMTDAQLRASAIGVNVTGVVAEDTPHASGDLGFPVFGVRNTADTSVGTNGDYALLTVDGEDRVKVSTKPAPYADVTGDITAIQATIGTPVAGGTVVADVSRASAVVAFCLGTFAGVNCTFEASLEASGDTNWFGIQAVRTNANTIETTTGALSSSPAYAWRLPVFGYKRIRVRATARTSGTQSWRFSLSAASAESIPAAQISGTQPVSGTVTLGATAVRVGFVAGAGIWFDDSSTSLGANATFTGTSRDATVTASAAAFAGASTYAQEVRACAESDVTGTLWLEVSRDNTNWRRIRSVAAAAITGGGFAAELIYRPAWRYWRVGYTNGAGAQARFALGTVAMAA